MKFTWILVGQTGWRHGWGCRLKTVTTLIETTTSIEIYLVTRAERGHGWSCTFDTCRFPSPGCEKTYIGNFGTYSPHNGRRRTQTPLPSRKRAPSRLRFCRGTTTVKICQRTILLQVLFFWFSKWIWNMVTTVEYTIKLLYIYIGYTWYDIDLRVRIVTLVDSPIYVGSDTH